MNFFRIRNKIDDFLKKINNILGKFPEYNDSYVSFSYDYEGNITFMYHLLPQNPDRDLVNLIELRDSLSAIRNNTITSRDFIFATGIRIGKYWDV